MLKQIRSWFFKPTQSETINFDRIKRQLNRNPVLCDPSTSKTEAHRRYAEIIRLVK